MFAGAEEGIFCALHSVIETEGHVIVITPCYQSLLENPKTKGADFTEIRLQEENCRRIDLEAVQDQYGLIKNVSSLIFRIILRGK